MSIRKRLTLGAAALLAATGMARADITILAWPGGPAEESLRQVVNQYNETRGAEIGSTAELLYLSGKNFFDKMLSELAADAT